MHAVMQVLAVSGCMEDVVEGVPQSAATKAGVHAKLMGTATCISCTYWLHGGRAVFLSGSGT